MYSVYVIDFVCAWQSGGFSSSEPVKLYSKTSKDECIEKCIAYKVDFDDSVTAIQYYAPGKACRCLKLQGGPLTQAKRFRCVIKVKEEN